jgi:hypothetical protein
MFLGVYHFDGSPAELLPAYERLMAGFPPDQIQLNVCVTHDRGMSVYDACPSSSVFAAFSQSDDFAGALEAVGLPSPRVEAIGEVHAARCPEHP